MLGYLLPSESRAAMGRMMCHTSMPLFDGGELIDKGLTVVAGLGNLGIHGYGTEKWHRQVLSHAPAATGTQNGGDFSALGADEAAHVFNHAQHWQLELLAEVDGFAHVDGGDLLGGGDNHCTVTFANELTDRKRLIFQFPAGNR